ncbi:SAF domain-containing protein [Roseibium salinum]|uniref:SAF domain-containing protein n=1 Tax=Roseibium salinum TaxID=1604349 RepID=A0ABT3R4R7_9HYPH|nr:SAF domain-containing protein [Roseibium sp. DSM 29163]MCX2724142.1 hypothetical protein [Roseibium sp. DSM 29163]
MKFARIFVLAIAVAAGFVAFRMVMMSSGTPEPEVTQAHVVEQKNAEVLVAGKDILLGGKLSPADLSWAPWPEDALPNGAVLKKVHREHWKSIRGRSPGHRSLPASRFVPNV